MYISCKCSMRRDVNANLKVCIKITLLHIYRERMRLYIALNQRTNGPVNAHLISWLSKAQNIQNLENIW